MKNFKFEGWAIIALFLLLAGCATPTINTTTTDNFDPSGALLSRTITESLPVKGGTDVIKDRALYKGNVDLAKEKTKQLANVTDPTAQVSLAAFEKLSPTASLGKNTGEIELAKKQENTKRFGIFGNFVGMLANLYQSGRGGDRDEGAIVVNGDGNSLQGINTGDNATVSHSTTDFVGGIPLNPADVEPIALGSPEEEEEVTDPEGNTCTEEELLANGGLCPS